MAESQHYTLLPDIKPYSCRFRPKAHAYKLPECSRDLYKKSFVTGSHKMSLKSTFVTIHFLIFPKSTFISVQNGA